MKTKKQEDIKFDFDDISLIPTKISNITSRNQINILNENGKLPIFVSPMDTVVDNYELLLKLGLNVCIPRKNPEKPNKKYNDECFISYGLDEIENIINNNGILPQKILIDVANAHSIRVFNISKKIKENYGIELMVGNIANPETYLEYAKIGVDYIRCGIGAGQVCTTSANSSIHYPMGSLIKEIREIRDIFLIESEAPKIIADGGFKNFDDIIKAIGIGADGVMLGSIINKSIESCGKTFNDKFNEISVNDGIKEHRKGMKIFKEYRGMSTKEVQKEWGKKVLHTSEGIKIYNEVEYSMFSWIENFVDYLKSCMSYQGKSTIMEFTGNSEFVFISQNSHRRFKK